MHDPLPFLNPSTAALMVDGSRDAILLVRCDGVILDVNHSATVLYGYSRDEFRQRSILDLRWPETHDQLPQHLSAALTGTGALFETVHRRRDGTTFPVEVSSRAVEFEGARCLVSAIRDISDRHQAAEALHRSEARFRSAIEHGDDAVLFLDGDGRVAYRSAAIERISGYSTEERLGRQAIDLVHPDDVGRFRALWDEAVAAPGTPITGEFRIRHKDGSSRWLAATSINRLDDEMFRGVVLTARDITERRLAEHALAESELRYRTLIEQAPIAIAYHRHGHGVFANQAHCRLHGYTTVPAGAHVRDFVAPESWPVVEQILRDRTEGRPSPTEYELVGRRRDGTTFPEMVKTAAIELPDGPATLVFHLDLTSERAALHALRQSMDLSETLVRSIPFPLEIVDRSGTILFANDLMTAAVGHDVVGQSCWQAYKDNGAKCDHCPLSSGVPIGRTERIESTGVLGGRIFEIYHTGLRYRDTDAILEIFIDITERKRLEEQYRQAQKMEAIGQLAGGVAHDFNNILAAIMMYLGLAKTMPGLDAELAVTVTELEGLARRAADLTRQLLMFSRRSMLSMRSVDLNALLAGLAPMLRRLIQEHIELRFEYESGLPATRADAGMIEQVIVNLVVNARDAMPQGGRVSLRTRTITFDESAVAGHPHQRPGQYVCLSVIDSGCGMTEATLARIFDPFFTTKGPGQGTGLGLATVHGIIAQHRGWVDVHSVVGHGTWFDVYLAADGGMTETATIISADVPCGRGETILLVEDDADLRLGIQRMLTALGYRVMEASNGLEALRQWSENPNTIDLVLTDVVMPAGISGLDLAHQLRQSRPDVRVIVTSGYSTDIVADGAPTDGHLVFMPKPYDRTSLAKAIRDLLDAG